MDWLWEDASKRLAFALLASGCLHAALLLTGSWPARHAPDAAPLEVRLVKAHPALALTTDGALEAKPPTPRAVSRKPGFSPPQELKGKALATALAQLAREEFYPRAAIEQGLEGRVVLLISLSAAGDVTAIEVADSSGHALLDTAAVRAAARIGSLPGAGRQVLLPVEFRLE